MTTTATTTKAEKAMPAEKLFFRIGDVADIVGVKPYVLRYWETEFPVLSPEKSGTGQRVYKRVDVETLLLIRHLLYTERYSIEGAKKRIKELKKEGALKHARRELVLNPKPLEGEKLTAAVATPARSLKGLKSEVLDLQKFVESELDAIWS